MKEKIQKAKLKLKKICSKIRANLSRKFDITLSLRGRKDSEKPVLSLNLKGEIPREAVAFFALLGAVTMLLGVIKLIRKIR